MKINRLKKIIFTSIPAIVLCLFILSHSSIGNPTPGSHFISEKIVNEPSADTIRVLNYNIRYGRGMDDVLDLRRIAQIIKDTEADLVALQEVDVGVERSFQIDLMKVLSGYTGLEPVFYKNIPHQGGEYGNGILSRFPIYSSRNYHIVVDGEGEQRGLLQTEIVIDDLKIAFMNTHLDHRPDDTQRLMSVEQIIDTKRAYRGMPIIVTGDFNDTPGSQTHLNMKEYFTDVWEHHGEGDGYTFSSINPNRRIDYVFYSNELTVEGSPQIRPVSIEVLQTEASDHLPILAIFVIER